MSNAVPGLILVNNFLTSEKQDALMQDIESSPWRADLQRRTQHYGYAYNYKDKTVSQSSYIGELPNWIAEVGEAANEAAKLKIVWQQAIINEYRPGTGIGEHADSRAFGAIVATISLLCKTTMIFRPSYHASQEIPVVLQPGSLAVMTGASRSPWTHEIQGSDITARRISITLRSLR